MASYNFFNIKFGKHGGTSHAYCHATSHRDKSHVVFTRRNLSRSDRLLWHLTFILVVGT